MIINIVVATVDKIDGARVRLIPDAEDKEYGVSVIYIRTQKRAIWYREGQRIRIGFDTRKDRWVIA